MLPTFLASNKLKKYIFTFLFHKQQQKTEQPRLRINHSSIWWFLFCYNKTNKKIFFFFKKNLHSRINNSNLKKNGTIRLKVELLRPPEDEATLTYLFCQAGLVPSGPCGDTWLVPGPGGPWGTRLNTGSIRPENLASLGLRVLQVIFSWGEASVWAFHSDDWPSGTFSEHQDLWSSARLIFGFLVPTLEVAEVLSDVQLWDESWLLQSSSFQNDGGGQ